MVGNTQGVSPIMFGNFQYRCMSCVYTLYKRVTGALRFFSCCLVRCVMHTRCICVLNYNTVDYIIIAALVI